MKYRSVRHWFRFTRRRWQARLDGLAARHFQTDPAEVYALTEAKPRQPWVAAVLAIGLAESGRNSPLTLSIRTTVLMPDRIADALVAERLARYAR